MISSGEKRTPARHKWENAGSRDCGLILHMYTCTCVCDVIFDAVHARTTAPLHVRLVHVASSLPDSHTITHCLNPSVLDLKGRSFTE